MTIDPHAKYLAGGVTALLTVSSIVGAILKRTAKTEKGKRTVDNLNARVRAWWVMAAVFGGAIFFKELGTTILFGLVSFLALREMITLSPTRRGDHHTLFWAFFVITPLQYYILYCGWYGLYTIFIPVYCFLFLAIRSTLTGDFTRYMERAAKIQWGVMICVYFVSHLPAILKLDVIGMRDRSWKLLVFLVVVVQMSDVLQYVWGKLCGRHKIAPNISPNKTVEGFVGGVLTASALAMLMQPLTPFNLWQSFVIGLVCCLMGFAGGIVMSAIKRDAGIKDYGHLIEGHGGMMDRIDSLTFAAPVFFHVVRFFFSAREFSPQIF